MGQAPPTEHRRVFFSPFSENTYGAAIETLEQVGKVVDSLYAKVRGRSISVWSTTDDDLALQTVKIA